LKVKEASNGPNHYNAGVVVVGGTRVLIVDDNETNRRILREMVTNWGMIPTDVENADLGIQSFREAASQGKPFGIILSDVNMPGSDGYEFAASIRDLPASADVPIIMLTSGGRTGDTETLKQLDITRRLTKPVKQSELFDAIVQVLGVNALENEENASIEEAKSSIKPLNILLVEDNVVNQKLAIGVLGKYGHETTLAQNGQEALDLLEDRTYDLILMDVQMPVMDGLTATREIRRRESLNGAHIPIIAMTAHAMKGDREECLEAGMDEYVPKPIRIAHLLDVFDRVIGNSEARLVLDEIPNPCPQTDATMVHDEEPEIDLKQSDEPTPVDLELILKSSGGDHRLLDVIIEAFCDESRSLNERICDAAVASDAKQLAIASHTLKGASGVIGARQLHDECAALESIGREQRMEQLDVSLQSYHLAYEKVQQWLAKRSGERQASVASSK
jgi:two-component system, sensor histidine kinase and response regulator